MIALRHPSPADMASRLRDDDIHVWQLDYAAAKERQPLLFLLAAYLGVEASHVVLVENEHGRPALAPAHATSIDFNWSHSGDHAVVAIGRGLELGVDLERVRARPRALEIAGRYFSADETAALAALPPAARDVAFLEFWTAKEAVLKALGRGIAFGLHRLSIATDGQRLSLRRLEGENVQEWQLRRLPVDATLIAALAWRGGARRIVCCMLAGAG
jgi:4'-phosphopantetheinyl transferase